jgi:type IV pilus assembly protein PilM
MAKAVGLDIGTRSVKIAELEGSSKRYRITRFASCDLPTDAGGDEPDALLERLTEFLRANRVGRDTVVTAIPAHGITIREITVPFKNEEQIRKVVKFEAETHLHATPIEDVVVEFVPVGETKDGTRLIIFAAPKPILRERLALLKRADIDPRAIDLDIVALFNAVSVAGLLDEDRNVVVADIGATATKLLFVQNGELRSVRSLRMGTDSITRQVGMDLDVPFVEAEERQALPAGPDRDRLLVPAAEVEPADVPETAKSAVQLETDVVVDRRRGFLEKVARELNRSMGAAGGVSGIDAFYVTGGGCRSPEVVEELSERFGVRVETLDLLEHIPHGLVESDPGEVNATGAVAIGLALKQLGAEPLQVDFRQEEFAFARKFEIIKLALAVGVAFVFILVFLYFLYLQRTVTKLEYQYEYYRADAERKFGDVKKRYELIIPDDRKSSHAPAPVADLMQVDANHRALLGIQDELVNELGINPDIPPIRSALGVMKEFVERIRRARESKIEYLKFDQIVLTQKTLKVKGTIGRDEDIGVLRGLFGLNADDTFQKFNARNISTNADGHTNLDIEIELREAQK